MVRQTSCTNETPRRGFTAGGQSQTAYLARSIGLRATLSCGLIVALLFVGCAKAPPSLTPVGARAWQANEAVLALNVLQSAAIGLNKIQVCEPAPCHSLLSDANTRVVGNAATSARNTIDAVPTGWKATAQAALAQIAMQLDAGGRTQLAAYLTAANTVVSALVP